MYVLLLMWGVLVEIYNLLIFVSYLCNFLYLENFGKFKKRKNVRRIKTLKNVFYYIYDIVGSLFVGAVAYMDDIFVMFLLWCVSKMLDICSAYGIRPKWDIVSIEPVGDC